MDWEHYVVAFNLHLASHLSSEDNGVHVPVLAAPLRKVKKGKRQKKDLKIERSKAALQSTTTVSVAGKHLKSMDEATRTAVTATLDNTLSKTINKTVKAAVIKEKYEILVNECFVEALTSARRKPEDMVHVKRKTLWEEYGAHATIKVGDWVLVDPCYMPGTCSEGGVGSVTHVNAHSIAAESETVSTESENPSGNINVLYILTQRVEHGVSFARVTVIPMPYKDKDDHGLRPRKDANVLQTNTVLAKRPPRDLSPLGWLQLGKASRMHQKKGWLRQLLINEGLLVEEDGPLWTRILSDYKFIKGAIEGMRIALGSSFVDPRDYKGIQGPSSGGMFISKKTNAQKDIPKNEFTQPYLLYAYDVSRTTFQNRVKNEKLGKCTSSESNTSIYKGTTAIENRALAKRKYTPRFFFARMHAMAAEPPPSVPDLWQKYYIRFEYYGAEYDKKAKKGEDLSYWERMAREHDARQPFIEQELVQVIVACPVMSYRDIALTINGWCSG